MSLRSSRRSNSNSTLNIATIQFLDKNRLVKELKERGLDTSGAKTVLSDRLYEFITNGSSFTFQTPSPTVSASAKKKKKATPKKLNKSEKVVKQEVEEVEEVEEQEEQEENEKQIKNELTEDFEQNEEPTEKNEKGNESIIDILDDEPDLLQLSSSKSKKNDDPDFDPTETKTPKRKISKKPEIEISIKQEEEDEEINESRNSAEVSSQPSPKLKKQKMDSTNPEEILRTGKRKRESSSDFSTQIEKNSKSLIIKKTKPTINNCSVKPKPSKTSWQEKWAEKLAEMKKPSDSNVPTARKIAKTLSSDSQKKKDSHDKTDVALKKKDEALEKVDAIAALMSSTLPKKNAESTKNMCKPERVKTEDEHVRAIGGADFKHFPMSPTLSNLPPPPPPKPRQMPPRMIDPMNKSATLSPMLHLETRPRRQSRFDQPPPSYAQISNNIVMKQAPTLMLAPKSTIGRIDSSSLSPPPPPPPPKIIKIEPHLIPPPPPPPPPPPLSSSSSSSSSSSCAAKLSQPSSSQSQSSSSSSPPPPPPAASLNSRRYDLKERVQIIFGPILGTTKDEQEESNEKFEENKVANEDDEFVIRDTIVSDDHQSGNETKAESGKKSLNKEEEAERENEDEEEEEYDPFENSQMTESSKVYDYVPTMAMEDEEEEDDDDDVDEEDDDDDEDGDEEISKKDEENKNTDEDDEMIEEEEEENNDNSKAVKKVELIETEIDFQEKNKEAPSARDLLKMALPVLQSLNKESEEKEAAESTDQYCQMIDDSTNENDKPIIEKENPEEVYYHGDPVPEVDENELFEIAAGIKTAKKKEKKSLVQIPDEERLPTDESIELDYYNADIHVKSNEDNIWLIEPFSQDGLALMWGGVRSNFGLQLPLITEKSLKLGFQIQIDTFQSIQHLPTEFMSETGDVRVGYSLSTAKILLGESSGSWCISSSGKRATQNHFTNFGGGFGIGDVITCILDFENGSLSFFKNDEDMGIAFNKLVLKDGDVVFPTICVKNANVHVNFGQDLTDEKWNLSPNRQWKFITEIDKKNLVRSRAAPSSKADCTMLMTIGLPAVGKTTWVRRYLAEHPHENWTLISADVVADAMKIDGVPRNRMATLKRPDFLRGIIGKSMMRLILLAPRRRKNFLLDMTNCILDKRKRKLMMFEGFNRKCMIFVPDEDVHLKRLIKQEHEENEKLDTDALMQHKAAMSIPTTENDPCEEVIFIDPPSPYEHLAFERVEKMNSDCRAWLVTGNRRNRGSQNHHHLSISVPNNHHNGPSSSQFSNPMVNSPSVRVINITHTTFPSSGNPMNSPHLKKEEIHASSSNHLPLTISPRISSDDIQAQEKASPLLLNRNSTRLSIDEPSSSSSKSAHLISTINGIPFPIDVKIPPPDFSQPPPPIPSIPPHLLMMRNATTTTAMSTSSSNFVPPPLSLQPPAPSQFVPR